MIKLKDLPIAGGKIKLLNRKCKELWRGYEIPTEFINAEIIELQAEVENFGRELLVIVLNL